MTVLRAKARLLLIVMLSLIVRSDCFAAPSFSTGIQTGSIQNALVNEASGIVASRMNANVLWAHDDSGNGAQVFPMTTAGANLGTYTISGASNVDWEDIAVGPGPAAGSQYLYIGDIGDNLAIRSSISVYRVPEPVVSDTQSPLSISLSGATRLTFTYPDGPRDAESMFVDPLSKDIYFISKRENPHHLYRAAYPQSTSSTTVLELMTTFADPNWLTAADISPNGNEIIARATGSTSGRLYARPLGGSITDAFNSAPITIPLRSEPQGEAIGFDPNGWGYYTTSEGVNQPIYYFDRLPPPAQSMYWDNDGVAVGSYLATGAGMGGTGTWNTSALKWYNGSADVRWLSGNDAIFWGAAGTVTLESTQSANSLTFKTDGYTLAAGALNLTGPTITVDSGVTATISSGVKGDAGLTKSGGGTLKLVGANTYTGVTAISGGALMVLNATGSGTGTDLVEVEAAAALGGTGTIQGNVANSGTITPGDSVGTLHIGGTYTQSTGGRLEIDLASSLNHDELAVSGTAALAGTLAVSLSGGFMPLAGDLFEVITTTGFSGTTFDNVMLPPLSGDLEWNLDYGANVLTLSVLLAGDFNFDGIVDAADYVALRKGGSSFTPGDFDTWRTNFGNSAGGGGLGSEDTSNVPEPHGAVVALLAILSTLGRRFRRCDSSC